MKLLTHLRRSAKYAVYLAFILVLITSIMYFINGVWTLPMLVKGGRLLYMILVIVGFALLYPFMGYQKRSVPFNATQNKDEVERVMLMCGYTLSHSEGDRMVFRSSKAFNRLVLLYEDAITIETGTYSSEVSGPRREVVKVIYRMGTFIN